MPDPISGATGDDAVQLAAVAGLKLDPWEQDVLRGALGERADGSWSAFEVGLVCARQNGKTEILIARILAGLFLLDERLIIFSAHQFDTALEAFQRLIDIVDAVPELKSRVAKIQHANGKEGITLGSGQRVKFKARTRKGGRGFTGDCLIYDEAFDLPEMAHGSTLPTLSARPNPQVWYAGSSVDQWQHENGVVLARLRERAQSDDAGSLAYFEWSAAVETPELVTPEQAADRDLWAQANPALGIRISAEHVSRELQAMGAREFAVERLGVGDWPSTDERELQVIAPEIWMRLLDPTSEITGPVFIAWDTTPDRGMTAVAASGKRDDDLWHVEIIEHKGGTGWLPEFLSGVVKRQDPAGLGTDRGAAGGSMLPAVTDKVSCDVHEFSGRDYANACGVFFDAVNEGTIRHRGQTQFDDAIRSASKRKLGEAWAWARTEGDISPLVAGTLALWGARTVDNTSVYEERELLVL